MNSVSEIKESMKGDLELARKFPKVFSAISYAATGFAFISVEQGLSDGDSKWYWWGIALIFCVVSWLCNLSSKGYLPERLLHAYIVAEELEKKELIIQKQLLLNRMMARIMKISIDEHLSSDRNIDIDLLVQDFILGAVGKTKNDLFGISEDEMWNFIVYLYNEDTKELECRTHLLSDTHPSYNPINNSPKNRRSWKKRDKSHISETFKRNEIFSIYNYNEQGAQSSRPPLPVAKRRDTDKETYQSFVSIPLKDPITDKPFGVFAATSNIPDRFSEKNERYLFDISRPLSSLYALSIHDGTEGG